VSGERGGSRLSGGSVWLLEGQARAQYSKSASTLYFDWPAFHCNFQLFRLRPVMAPVGMSRTVTPETISLLMISCLFVIIHICVLYVVGYDGVN